MVAIRCLRHWWPGIAALLVAVPAAADVKAGVDAWTRGDFATAVGEWIEPATTGDADAQFNLGQAYKLGRGVKQDLAKAEELFAKAAGQGHLQASDTYGLLLFQRGERARALPYISAAADRGDPRSQYLLGIALFNGDSMPKNWERAYALVSLAHRAGLAQATGALAQMDAYIPLEQRQKSAALAQELAAQADATRARQLASADLGSTVPNLQTTPVPAALPRPPLAAAVPASPAIRPPLTAVAATTPAPTPKLAAVKPPRTAATAALAAPAGNWRVQLGAFGVARNADAMWERVRARPEVAGRAKVLVPAGKVMKLQAAGYASEAAAKSACTRLASAGINCLAVAK